MAKIAAIILPAGQASRLEDYQKRMQASLCLYFASYPEYETYWGRDEVCCLFRIAPDPLNITQQPIASGSTVGVVCGYYLSPHSVAADSASAK